MKRVDIVNVIGNEFNTTNIEGGEWSYIQDAGSSEKLEKKLGRKPKHFKLDIRFKKNDLVVLVETKQDAKDKDTSQLKDYYDEEVALHKENTKIICILANTKNDKVRVWKGDIVDNNELKKEKKIENIKHYEDLFNVKKSTEEEIKKKEEELVKNLKEINEDMHDTEYHINESDRIQFICGLIMAGLGVEEKNVKPLELSELKGENSIKSNDGVEVVKKITAFLENRKLPQDKLDTMTGNFEAIFRLKKDMWQTINGEDSKIKYFYKKIYDDFIPILKDGINIDITGTLFNTISLWFMGQGGDGNSIVLTPRQTTELMAKLCKINKDSRVWDFCAGSSGFLVSAMKEMIRDAQDKIVDREELEKKIYEIKSQQLLGVELNTDMYMLSVLNMILMGDGCSNLINGDSLKFNGKLDGDESKNEFKADTFLLNPPYNQKGRGMVFVDKAFKLMNEQNTDKRTMRGAVLIMDSAGSGQGDEYNKSILQENSLIASIKMPSDLFCGKAGVQTSIYLFEIGKPHDKDKKVKFIDFSNDGYARSNRRKASQETNLKNVDNAEERYREVIDLVEYGYDKDKIKHLKEENYIEDKISLEGNDWNYSQHKKIDTKPTEEDFKKVVADYLSWKVSAIIKGDIEIESESK